LPPPSPASPPFPYTTLFRSVPQGLTLDLVLPQPYEEHIVAGQVVQDYLKDLGIDAQIRIVEWGVWLSDTYGGPRNFDITVVGHTDRKSTRLNSSHVKISYAV